MINGTRGELAAKDDTLRLKKQKVPPLIINALPKLETLHKSLVLYIWLSLRLEVSFPDRLVAQELKTMCEAALEECLQRLPGLKLKKGAVDMAAGKAWEKKAEADRLGEGEGVEWVSGAEYQKTKKARIWKDVALLEEEEGVKKRLFWYRISFWKRSREGLMEMT
ncbi:hypothetical protein B9479_000558 [Cryptococcus floricola]|uniref:ATP-dependent RNA helicase SUV3 C-terminal domain-containing protein n=1 Tax=Cryptococcus floricola TaxID=2591691 RepID=A0A5D3B710_9TREE|nr:hypothetical protein B9479_000558 [Cryptococcus floricola]